MHFFAPGASGGAFPTGFFVLNAAYMLGVVHYAFGLWS